MRVHKWLIEQKVIIFLYGTDIRNEPARPVMTLLTAYFSNVVKDTNLKLLHNLDTGLEIVVSHFIEFKSLVPKL